MRICIILILSSLFTAGCRVNPRAEREIALLRAEILDLEDQYYSLKSRCEGTVVSGGTGEVFYDTAIIDDQCVNCSPGTVYYNNDSATFDAPSQIIENRTPTESNFDDVDNLESLDNLIEDPDGTESINSDGSTSRLQIVPHADERLPRKISYPGKRRPTLANTSQVTSILINRQISRGEDLDGRPGDEGLSLLLQPIDAKGNVRKQAGHITVRVTESSSPNVERQIGLWQFTPEESKSFFVKDEYAQQGILLHLPWDRLAPKGNRLNVLVRYTNADQQTIESRARIRIVPPANNYSPDAPLVAGWIERDDRWVDVAIEPFDEITSNFDENFTQDQEPEFRDKAPTTKRRISAPGWRPVR